MDKKFALYFFFGACLGLGAGFGLGVFQAPDSGDRTRRKFAKRAARLKKMATKSLNKNTANAK